MAAKIGWFPRGGLSLKSSMFVLKNFEPKIRERVGKAFEFFCHENNNKTSQFA